MYKGKELGWRDAKVKAFGEFEFEEMNGIVMENIFETRLVEVPTFEETQS
jgi:hypothetical protein